MTARVSRREFLKISSAFSSLGVAAPTALNLALMENAAAAEGNDYRAMVCVFLYGGNDQYNTLVPYEQSEHALYEMRRPSFAIPRAELASTVLEGFAPGVDHDGRFALHPNLAPLMRVFDDGNLLPIMNVGTLIQPLTRAEYSNRRRSDIMLPPRLFSHNDQQSYWMASATEGAGTGWGGRMADLLMSQNGANSGITSLNLGGRNVYQQGLFSDPYRISPAGPINVNTLANAKPWAGSLKRILSDASSSNLMMSTHQELTTRSLGFVEKLAGLNGFDNFPTATFPTSPLGTQLKRVAINIHAGKVLGLRRQVFMVGIGGFDNHKNMSSVHPARMTELGEGLAAFYRATQDLGVQNDVLAYTMSDFGRTWGNTNGGSDHGWGSTQFVMGGAVKGRQIAGKPPRLTDLSDKSGGDDSIGSGRLLPTTAVEQMGATMASWMGVTNSELDVVFPHLQNFSDQNLGFLES